LPGHKLRVQAPVIVPFDNVPCSPSTGGPGPGPTIVIVKLPVVPVKVPDSVTFCDPIHGSKVVKLKFVMVKLPPLPSVNAAANVAFVVPSELVNVANHVPLIFGDEFPPHPGKISPNTRTHASPICFIALPPGSERRLRGLVTRFRGLVTKSWQARLPQSIGTPKPAKSCLTRQAPASKMGNPLC
jgi:hypothetical protein